MTIEEREFSMRQRVQQRARRSPTPHRVAQLIREAALAHGVDAEEVRGSGNGRLLRIE